jgi:acid-sensing ion channel, other
MIHNSHDYPDENAETKVIMARLEAFVSVAPGKKNILFLFKVPKYRFALIPESTYSTDDVYPLAQNVRDCMADYEMRMSTMTQYSYVNCLAECRSEIAFRKCGCIPFDLPNNNTKPTCNMNHIRCIQDNMGITLQAG